MRALLKKIIIWALDGEFDRPKVTIKPNPAAIDAIAQALKK